MTHTCENMTFPQLLLRAVIIFKNIITKNICCTLFSLHFFLKGETYNADWRTDNAATAASFESI